MSEATREPSKPHLELLIRRPGDGRRFRGQVVEVEHYMHQVDEIYVTFKEEL